MKEYVLDLSDMAKKMVRLEAVGVGDTDNAMRRLADRHRLPYQLFWKLRFRLPKQVAFDLVLMFREAYRKECLKVAGRLTEEADEILEGLPQNGIDAALLLEARRIGDCSIRRLSQDESQ